MVARQPREPFPDSSLAGLFLLEHMLPQPGQASPGVLTSGSEELRSEHFESA